MANQQRPAHSSAVAADAQPAAQPAAQTATYSDLGSADNLLNYINPQAGQTTLKQEQLQLYAVSTAARPPSPTGECT